MKAWKKDADAWKLDSKSTRNQAKESPTLDRKNSSRGQIEKTIKS